MLVIKSQPFNCRLVWTTVIDTDPKTSPCTRERMFADFPAQMKDGWNNSSLSR